MNSIANTPPPLSIAQVVPLTEAEGPGRRFAIWFQGCPLRCPGCCNPEMLSFDGGAPTSVEDLLGQIAQAAQRDRVEGVTLLGGEPFSHADGAHLLAMGVRKMGLSIMVFSGFLLEELREMPSDAARTLLDCTDILVDGPYQRELPETRRRWIGSQNQRIHFLTDRYQTDDPRWRQPNTLEIRLNGAELTVNGFPAPGAVGMWRRPKTATSKSDRQGNN